jgi:hypothetical protein
MAASTLGQKSPLALARSSTESQAVSVDDTEHHSASSDVLPDPAGATTNVSGAVAALSRSPRSRGRDR